MDELVLNCANLTKGYGPQKVFNRFDLLLYSGKIVGLLGPNGSGKTTLIKLIAGLITPEFGTISVCGKPVGAESKALVSYLPDRNILPSHHTVLQLIMLYENMFADFDPQRALAMLTDLNVNVSARFSTLSKGNREKVQLILTMSRRAKLYLLDEPIAGVDPATRDYILETILKNYDREATILISTHLIADVENVLDEFIFLHNGTVLRYGDANSFRESEGCTLDEAFRRDFRC